MKTKSSLLLVAILFIGAADAPSARTELDKVAGKWSVSELIYNGADHSTLNFNFTFKGDEGIIEGNDELKQEYAAIKIKLDPKTIPRTMDFSVVGGTQKDEVIEGIYELKGNELRICARVSGKDRPTKFASPDGSNIVLIVLKRANP